MIAFECKFLDLLLIVQILLLKMWEFFLITNYYFHQHVDCGPIFANFEVVGSCSCHNLFLFICWQSYDIF